MSCSHLAYLIMHWLRVYASLCLVVSTVLEGSVTGGRPSCFCLDGCSTNFRPWACWLILATILTNHVHRNLQKDKQNGDDITARCDRMAPMSMDSQNICDSVSPLCRGLAGSGYGRSRLCHFRCSYDHKQWNLCIFIVHLDSHVMRVCVLMWCHMKHT